MEFQEERESHRAQKSDNYHTDNRSPCRVSVFVSHLQRHSRNSDLSPVAMEGFSVVSGRIQIADRCPDIRIRYVNRCSPDLFAACPLIHKNDPVFQLIEIPQPQFANWQLLQAQRAVACTSSQVRATALSPELLVRSRMNSEIHNARDPVVWIGRDYAGFDR